MSNTPFFQRVTGDMQSLSATLILYLRVLEEFEGSIQVAKALKVGDDMAEGFDSLDIAALSEQGSSIMNKVC